MFSTKKYIYILGLTLILLLQSKFAYSEEHQSSFNQGNTAYQSEQYEQAISLYESILDAGQESPLVYYNLGNAWFKQGSIGQSILNYERALALDPNFEDAQHNLELAQTRAVDRIVAVPEFLVFRVWKGFRDSLTSSQWAGVAIAFFWLAMGLGLLFLFGKKNQLKKGSFLTAVLSLGLAIFCCVLAASKYQLELQSPYGIIMEQAVYVKSAPGDDSNDIFILHEGAKVEQVDRLGEWIEIRLADGKKGWVKPEVMEGI